MASLRVSCVVALMCMVVITAPMSEAAISCGSVAGALAPCLNYLTGRSSLSPGCCIAVRRLNAQAQSSPDRKDVCNCLKGAAGSIRGLNLNTAATLPGKCGVTLPYTISPSTNCNAIGI
ncbi:unnamed protein product [Vicia faba]|uniref:Non-specific lipid-transfer protein n=1 Tax=Vicia faba TaxID=3906 RepID=A0AAV0ZQG8_VICFA|nr:unnamed protein product [Vicia faba]